MFPAAGKNMAVEREVEGVFLTPLPAPSAGGRNSAARLASVRRHSELRGATNSSPG
jgi:hypothetical protein